MNQEAKRAMRTRMCPIHGLETVEDHCSLAEPLPQNHRCEREVPAELRAVIEDGLTPKGVDQWWHARSRYLKGARPCETWDINREAVLTAADAWASGVYL